jgi:Zn-dependent protease with chaperone function
VQPTIERCAHCNRRVHAWKLQLYEGKNLCPECYLDATAHAAPSNTPLLTEPCASVKSGDASPATITAPAPARQVLNIGAAIIAVATVLALAVFFLPWFAITNASGYGFVSQNAWFWIYFSAAAAVTVLALMRLGIPPFQRLPRWALHVGGGVLMVISAILSYAIWKHSLYFVSTAGVFYTGFTIWWLLAILAGAGFIVGAALLGVTIATPVAVVHQPAARPANEIASGYPRAKVVTQGDSAEQTQVMRPWSASRKRVSFEAITAEPEPLLVALFCGWTSVGALIGIAGVVAFLGFCVGLIVGTFFFGLAAVVAFTLLFAGIAALFACIGLIGIGISAPVLMLVGGAFAWVLTSFIVRVEEYAMTIHGYRRMSHRERALVSPMVENVVRKMNVGHPPTILIHDIITPSATTYTRHIVLSKRSLSLDGSQLEAIIAHEMHHYIVQDSVKSTYLWACALPVALLVNAKLFLDRRVGPLVGLILSVLIWPALLMLRFAIAPAAGRVNREREYAADAAATDAGYGSPLIKMLEAIRVFEPGRTGWDSVMAATHPPIELRIEAVQQRLGIYADDPGALVAALADTPS